MKILDNYGFTGFAHGFFVLSQSVDFLYKTTDYYNPTDEQSIRWDDPDLNIDWQLNDIIPSLSLKDKKGLAFRDAPKFL